ncbi:MAG TPA: sigma-54 dependent transcriptional regulator, partial [Candidatus Kapabacteria bacterium]|nr:sigma-54 dependent transcriptional regulator [Candidatus Kapabacteria bacterium]
NYSTILTHFGYKVVLASSVAEAMSHLRSEEAIDLVLTDMRIGAQSGLDLLREARRLTPDLDIIVLTGHAEMANAIEAMKLGAADYLTKDADYREILLTIEKVLEKRTLKSEIARLREQVQGQYSFRNIVGASRAMKEVLAIIERVAPTDSRVLLTGETGTGKELVAETIHLNSPRKNGPFVAINCGAIPVDLQESELFGHLRGAFTGAMRDKKGLLEAADEGTVFLDEIGEMTTDSQVKLLRFLENGEFTPVGSTTRKIAKVRVIAATNRDLAEAIRDHSFRDDLYYRLKVISLHLPPLRERKEDIPLLATALLEDLRPRVQHAVPQFSDAAMEALIEYRWPGNVRELKNAIERALIFAHSHTIEIEDLPEELFRVPTSNGGGTHSEGTLPLDKMEMEYILQILEKNGGNKLQTAKQLNIATTTLYRKLRVYGIE